MSSIAHLYYLSCQRSIHYILFSPKYILFSPKYGFLFRKEVERINRRCVTHIQNRTFDHTNERTNKQTNKQTNKRTNERTNKPRTNMDCFFPPLTSVGSGTSSIEPVSANSSMCNTMEPVEKKKTHLWGKGVLAQLRKCDGVERYTRSSSETIEPVSANSSMCNTMEPVEKRKTHLWGKGVLAQLRKCDGVERYTQSSSEMIKNRMGRVIARKRMGAEYHPRNRTANRVISKDNGKPSYIDSRYSEDTYPTDAITDSSASEEEYDGYTSEWTTRTNASEWTTKTSETEKKSYVSWLDNSNDQTSKNNGKQTDHVSPSTHKDVPSPTSSVGAVKISAKDRFDYIRSKNRLQFAINPAQKDPPSDKTMMTSRSIRAADAGSILFKSVHRRKNELATQIINRRQKIPVFSQFGYEP